MRRDHRERDRHRDEGDVAHLRDQRRLRAAQVRGRHVVGERGGGRHEHALAEADGRDRRDRRRLRLEQRQRAEGAHHDGRAEQHRRLAPDRVGEPAARRAADDAEDGHRRVQRAELLGAGAVDARRVERHHRERRRPADEEAALREEQRALVVVGAERAVVARRLAQQRPQLLPPRHGAAAAAALGARPRGGPRLRQRPARLGQQDLHHRHRRERRAAHQQKRQPDAAVRREPAAHDGPRHPREGRHRLAHAQQPALVVRVRVDHVLRVGLERRARDRAAAAHDQAAAHHRGQADGERRAARAEAVEDPTHDHRPLPTEEVGEASSGQVEHRPRRRRDRDQQPDVRLGEAERRRIGGQHRDDHARAHL